MSNHLSEYVTKRMILYSNERDINSYGLSYAIDELKELAEEFGNDAVIEFSTNYEGDTGFCVRYYETEKAFNIRQEANRVKAEETLKRNQENELKLFKELKAKYEPT